MQAFEDKACLLLADWRRWLDLVSGREFSAARYRGIVTTVSQNREKPRLASTLPEDIC